MVLVLHPRLPAGPLAAAEWVAMLGAGSLDAEVVPQQAASVIELLWAATQHAVPQVCSTHHVLRPPHESPLPLAM